MKRLFSQTNPRKPEEDTSNVSASTSAGASSTDSVKQKSDDEPPIKQCKTETAEITSPASALQEKMASLLNCVVCFDIPIGEIYQCHNGHLVCEGCYVRLLADSIMRKLFTRCPLCRIFISKKKSIRSLTAERLAALIPTDCAHCSASVLRRHFAEHVLVLCPERATQCKYRRIGCKWSGPHSKLQDHELNCEQAKKPLAALLPEILAYKAHAAAESNTLAGLLKSLGNSRFFFEDLHTLHYDYNNMVHSIYFCTGKFRVYDLNWSLKLKFVHPEYLHAFGGVGDGAVGEGGNGSCVQFGGSYQILLRSRPNRNINAQFFLIHNSSTGVNLPLHVHEHEFSSYSLESDYKALPLASNLDTYRLLSKSKIHFRLVMIVRP